MVAADEFDGALGDVLVRIFRTNFVVVIDIQAVFGPRARIVDDVEKRKVAVRAIGKIDFVHGVALLYRSVLCEAGLFVNMEIYLSLSLAAHFSQICSRFSALYLLATLKRSRHGKGLHASISMRLIVKSPFSRFSGGRR